MTYYIYLSYCFFIFTVAATSILVLKSQRVTTVLKDVKTEITVTTNNNNMETYNVPKEILDVFTLGIPNYEDKELFLLQHCKIEMEKINKTVKK